MVPPTLRSAYLAMAERKSRTPAPVTAWDDSQDLLLDGNGGDLVAIYGRVHAALGAVRSAYLGTGCLTYQGRVYLALPTIPVPPEDLG